MKDGLENVSQLFQPNGKLELAKNITERYKITIILANAILDALPRVAAKSRPAEQHC